MDEKKNKQTNKLVKKGEIKYTHEKEERIGRVSLCEALYLMLNLALRRGGNQNCLRV